MERKLIFQGAEAKIYEGKWFSKDVIVKERFRKAYRLPELDAHLTKERIRNEIRSLLRCRTNGIRVPCVYYVDDDANEIYMERLANSCTVRELINHYASEGRCFVDDENTRLSEPMEKLATKIGTILAKLHKLNIIHGDLTTSNMMVQEPFDHSEIMLIDFGLSSVDEKIEEKAVDLFVLEKATLGTHVNTEKFLEKILSEYEKCGKEPAHLVIKKLDDVRLRGRKKLCFG